MTSTDTTSDLPTGHDLGIGRQIRSFALIGLVSTLAYAGIYAALRVTLPAPIANAVALVTTAVGNTAANRRLTFRARGRRTLVRDYLAGLCAFGAALAITTTALGGLATVAPLAGRVTELGVLIGANGAATVVRFALLRAWLAPTRTLDRTAFASTASSSVASSATVSSSSIRLERTVS